MRDSAVTRYLFPVEVRGIHVMLVMYGGSAEAYDLRRRGGGDLGPPHVVAVHPATAREIRERLEAALIDRELSQSTIEAAMSLGEVWLIELETLHRLATELSLLSALPAELEADMGIAGPVIANFVLSICHDVTSKLLTSRKSTIPVSEGDALIAQAIAGTSVRLDAALVHYCRTFFSFLESLLFMNQEYGVRPDSDLYAMSIFLRPPV